MQLDLHVSSLEDFPSVGITGLDVFRKNRFGITTSLLRRAYDILFFDHKGSESFIPKSRVLLKSLVLGLRHANLYVILSQ